MQIEITRFDRITNAIGRRETITHKDVTTWILGEAPAVEVKGSIKATKLARLEGWSPGTFRENHRCIANVERLYAIGLDLDEDPCVPLGRAWTLLGDFSGIVHSTFSHTPEAPRGRAILWTDRAIDAEEYRQIHDAISSKLRSYGIGVGKQAKDPSRCWFAPARPVGGTFEAMELKGPLLDVGAWLASALALAEVSKPKLRLVPKPVASAPRGGATAVARARAWLEHAEAAVEGQGGSNVAFRVVERVVRGFELSDYEAQIALSDWNSRCQPPWSDKELLHKITDGRERGDTAIGELLNTAPRDGGAQIIDDDDIKLTQDNGSPAKNAANVARMLALYPRGMPRLNEFADVVVWPDGANLEDSDAIDVQDWLLTQKQRVRVGVDTALSGIIRAAKDHKFHPVQDYLRSLTWDGVARVDGLAHRYFMAPDTELNRVISSCFLISAVARVMVPGVKHDDVPIFEGKQGTYKSTAMRVLASDEWFCDTAIDLRSKDRFENLRGVWIYELQEIDAIYRHHDASLAKGFFSSKEDKFRPSYGRVSVTRPRSLVFVGTTNHDDYHYDTTGGRRIQPVVCGKIDIVALKRDRDQLWAEAVRRYDAGEGFEIPEALWPAAKAEVEKRFISDPWEDIVAPLLAVHVGGVTTKMVFGWLGIDSSKQNKSEKRRLYEILRRCGWETRTVRLGEMVESGWVRSVSHT